MTLSSQKAAYLLAESLSILKKNVKKFFYLKNNYTFVLSNPIKFF